MKKVNNLKELISFLVTRKKFPQGFVAVSLKYINIDRLNSIDKDIIFEDEFNGDLGYTEHIFYEDENIKIFIRNNYWFDGECSVKMCDNCGSHNKDCCDGFGEVICWNKNIQVVF